MPAMAETNQPGPEDGGETRRDFLYLATGAVAAAGAAGAAWPLIDSLNPSADLIDPEPDGARVRKDEWLVVVGICTHLGCIPQGQRPLDPRGAHGGWFCTCHGSVYDISGRVRRGPAPRNLVVPPYAFLDETMVRIG